MEIFRVDIRKESFILTWREKNWLITARISAPSLPDLSEPLSIYRGLITRQCASGSLDRSAPLD